ncbi:MAG: TlpA family protein disulfide reductase, partial [Planctomycetaceae bacterium]|nr:TlpA family protein disulfide reductase [Planctomycetaceae bacterium]
MSKSILKMLSILIATIVSIVLLTSIAIIADEKSKKVNSIDEANTVEEIIAFSHSLLSKIPKENEARIKFIHELGKIWLTGGDKIIKIADNETKKIEGIKLKLGGFHHLIYAVQNDPNKKILDSISEPKIDRDNWLEELKKDGQYPLIVNDEYYVKFSREDAVELSENFSLHKFNEFFEQAKKLSVVKPAGYKQIDPLIKTVNVAISANAVKIDPQLASHTIKNIIAFINSEEFILPAEEKKAALEKLDGYLLRVVGASPEIYGKTVDDKDFHWSELRGKYVLVKFTASWCGPCKREIPGMRTAYEKYHDKGLEIVSIYIWDNLAATKKIIENEGLTWQ